jgi:hypothetical protein
MGYSSQGIPPVIFGLAMLYMWLYAYVAGFVIEELWEKKGPE